MTTMTVWSGGSEKAKTAKIEAIMYGLTFLMLMTLHVITIAQAFLTHSADTIIMAIMLACILCWLTALMLFACIDAYHQIKDNKKIPLYLFPIDDFATIGCIPDDKFILFSDKNGIVLAKKEYSRENKNFAFHAERFTDFTDYNKRNNYNECESD